MPSTASLEESDAELFNSVPVIESLLLTQQAESCADSSIVCIDVRDADGDAIDVIWELADNSPPALGPELVTHSVDRAAGHLLQCVSYQPQEAGTFEVRTRVYERRDGVVSLRSSVPVSQRILFQLDECTSPASPQDPTAEPGEEPPDPIAEPPTDPVAEPSSSPEVTPASPSDTYDIELIPVGDVSAELLDVFREASARLSRLIVGDLPEVRGLTIPEGLCGTAHPELTDYDFDDLTLFVHFESLDGPGGTLAKAGPCGIRTTGSLPFLGVMIFDVDDSDWALRSGRLSDIILHEMTHTLGFGTLWKTLGLLVGAGTEDPVFVGPSATEAFFAIGGASYLGDVVPVENQGGLGTADGHFRESVFGHELMTGYIDPSDNPFSLVSLGALQDMGYEVDPAEADSYVLPQSGSLELAAAMPSADSSVLSSPDSDIFDGPTFAFRSTAPILSK